MLPVLRIRQQSRGFSERSRRDTTTIIHRNDVSASRHDGKSLRLHAERRSGCLSAAPAAKPSSFPRSTMATTPGGRAAPQRVPATTRLAASRAMVLRSRRETFRSYVNFTSQKTLSTPPTRMDSFVSISATATRFAFDDGTVYYPIGADAAWGKGGDDEVLLHTLNALAMRGGANWTRVWMNHWDGKNLDWETGKQGHYDQLDLTAARRWDRIVAESEKDGLYLQLTLQHHGPYSTRVDSNWGENPWNRKKRRLSRHARRIFHQRTRPRPDPREVSLHHRPLGLLTAHSRLGVVERGPVGRSHPRQKARGGSRLASRDGGFPAEAGPVSPSHYDQFRYGNRRTLRCGRLRPAATRTRPTSRPPSAPPIPLIAASPTSLENLAQPVVRVMPRADRFFTMASGQA